ncbi:unnamed protein product [Haemonchus placei]|uniref:Uncharacterized protein n=1 Tax=Haemonchus placei TaxID=6290 RepID=A0A0N4VSC7_HAEPC|nr:unnamed protein product [Haemonchus placei]
MRQLWQRGRRQRRYPRQHEFGYEHRFVRKLDNSNRTMCVAYAPSSSYQGEQLEVFNMDLKKLYKGDHIFFKVIAGDFNANIGPSKRRLISSTSGLTETMDRAR